ncbi:MAG: hypothetical protein Q7S19_00155 [bacterium]|nr:hypothetical protein [bacterium]
MSTSEVEVLSQEDTEEIEERFVDAWADLEAYVEVVERRGFKLIKDPVRKLAELLERCFTDDQIAQYNERHAGKTTYNKRIKNLEHEILRQRVLQNADAIYSNILKCGRLMYANSDLPWSGYTKESIEEFLMQAGLSKEDIDGHKDYEEDEAGHPIYPETVRVEPITNEKKLREFLQKKL